MARKRMIDPNIWQSEDFSRLSTLAKIIFIGLFSNADDQGRGRAKAAYVKSTVFPYDDALRLTDIEKSLNEIAANMSITFYTHDGNEYYSLDNWDLWQKVEKPQTSKIPACSDDSVILRGRVGERSGSDRGRVDDQSRLIEKNRIEQEKEKKYIVEQQVETVIAFLNEKAGTSYRASTEATKKHIRARLAEGYTVEDFKDVIEKKCAEWLGTDYAKYLRPETLFGSKFEGYLNAKVTPLRERSAKIDASKTDLDDLF